MEYGFININNFSLLCLRINDWTYNKNINIGRGVCVCVCALKPGTLHRVTCSYCVRGVPDYSTLIQDYFS